MQGSVEAMNHMSRAHPVDSKEMIGATKKGDLVDQASQYVRQYPTGTLLTQGTRVGVPRPGVGEALVQPVRVLA